jgi:uncharacterized hydrophobic protein (TIGR00271 family)
MTFHVRLVSAPDRTGDLVEALAADTGVSNLVVLPGAAHGPAGDAVQFDVRPRSANAVFRHLQGYEQDHSTVAIEYVDAALGERAPASGHFLVQRDVVPVWEVIEARIRSDAVYAPSFYVLLAIAGLIGAVGILTNSQILIVGAMVVGPEYNAIMGIALGIDKRAKRPVIRGVLALIAGFSAAMIVTLLFALAIRWSGHTPGLYSLGVRPVSSLIDNPNLFSIVVAVLAGIAGVVSLTEARAGALIGVFISVTTIPAAADVGLSVGYESWSEARGAALQLLLNVAVLIAIGALGLRAQRIIWGSRERAEASRNTPGTVLATRPVGDVQALDDRSHEFLWRAIGGHDERVLRRVRQLQIIELAAQEARGEEMPVPGGEPGRVCVTTDIQEHEPRGGPPVQERIPVGALEGRARHDTGFARGGALVHPRGDRTQPGPPVVVGQRYSRGHLGDAGGGVKVIAVSEGPAQPACQQCAHRRLAAARHPGHHDDHLVIADPHLPSSRSSRGRHVVVSPGSAGAPAQASPPPDDPAADVSVNTRAHGRQWRGGPRGG